MSDARTGTREALLIAAERLFSRKGYAAVGTREIVRLAGVNISAITYHFGSKRELYLETISRSMRLRETAVSWDLLPDAPRSPAEAAVALVRFVRDFLRRTLMQEEIAAPTRLLLQEALHPSEAIQSVLQHFSDSRWNRMETVIATIAPALELAERRSCAGSIMAQFIQFAIFRPLLAYGPDGGYSDPARIEQAADHIARFSLRGLGCPEELIERVVLTSRADPLVPAPRR